MGTSLDVRSWMLVVECFPLLQGVDARDFISAKSLSAPKPNAFREFREAWAVIEKASNSLILTIPTGLRLSAQGCEERATLGKLGKQSQPQRGCGSTANLSKPISDEHSDAFNIVH